MPKQSSHDLDNDHTDELPVLLETVVLDAAGVPLLTTAVPEDTSRLAIAAAAQIAESSGPTLPVEAAARAGKIDALEADIARLSSRWREIEQHLAEKDALIGHLNRTIETLRQSVQEGLATERSLREQLAHRDTRLRDLAADEERLQREDESREAELARLRAEAAAARQAALALEQRLAAASTTSADPGEIQALLEDKAALAAYIEGRRVWWDESRAAHTGLAVRVAALEHDLAVSAQRLQQAAALAARESGRATGLRAELADYTRRLDAAERELRATRADAATAPTREPLARSAPHATQTVAAAAEDRPSPSRAPAATLAPVRSAAPAETSEDSVPAPGVEVIAQLEAEVGYKRQQVAAQLIELRDREHRLATLTAEIERVRHDLAMTCAELEHSRRDVARIERAVIDKDRALQARDARISTLQSELDQRLGALQRLNSVALSAQGLDSKMSEHLRLTESHTEAPHAPELICLTGDAPKRFALTNKAVTVGRGAHCDLQIVTHFVSREHARISLIDNAAVIEDLGSRNGVFVNSVKVERQKLQQGDLITIGETQFRFIESMAH